MKSVAHKILTPSWKTSAVGWVAILWGAWLAHVLYVSTQTLYFNLVYALPNAELFIVLGVGLLCARDHNVSSEQAGLKKQGAGSGEL